MVKHIEQNRELQAVNRLPPPDILRPISRPTLRPISRSFLEHFSLFLQHF